MDIQQNPISDYWLVLHCVRPDLTGFSHLCQITLFSFFKYEHYTLVKAYHRFSLKFVSLWQKCFTASLSWFFPRLKWHDYFLPIFLFKLLRLQNSHNLIFCFTLSASYSVPGNWKPSNQCYHWALGKRKTTHNGRVT